MQDIAEYMDFVNWLELNTPVATWRIGTVPLWPILRMRMVWEFHSFSDRASTTQNEISGPDRIYMHRNQISRKITNENEKIAFDYIFVSNNTLRTLLDNGRSVNTIIDPVASELRETGRKCLVMEHENPWRLVRFNEDDVHHCYFNEDRKRYLENLSLDMGSVEVCVPGMKEVKIALAKYGFNKVLKLIDDSFEIVKFFSFKEYFRAQLQKFKPSAVYFTWFYGFEHMAYVHTAREMGIRTIDLQHGHQGPIDNTYSRWKALPPEGYPIFPDVFAVWDECDKKNLEKWLCNIETQYRPDVQVIGHPWIESWKKNNALTNHYDEVVSSVFGNKNGKRRLLFTHQDSSFHPEWLVKAFKEIALFADILFRVHPGSVNGLKLMEEQFRQAGLANIELEKSTSLPLPALLRTTDIHVTCFSSCVLDAKRMEVPSIVITETGRAHFEQLLDGETCWAATTEKEFVSKVQELVGVN